MMRELGRTIGDTLFENLGRAAGRVQENRPIPADVLEGEDAYLVVFDAPGASASDVQVRYVDDRVEVRVDRFRSFYDDFEMVYPGRGLSLDGSATLAEDAVVDVEDATATLLDDGTLQVRVPKGWGSPEGEDGAEAGRVDDSVEEVDEREDAGARVDEADDDAEDGRDDEASVSDEDGDAEADEGPDADSSADADDADEE